jgi:hypothetical protein
MIEISDFTNEFTKEFLDEKFIIGHATLYFLLESCNLHTRELGRENEKRILQLYPNLLPNYFESIWGYQTTI